MSVPFKAHLIWHFFVGFSYHKGLVYTPFPVPSLVPHIQIDVVNGLFFFSLPTADPAYPSGGQTFCDDVSLMGRTTDATFIVPHIAIPPSPLMLLVTFFGSSQIIMGSSQTKVHTKNVVWQSEDESDIGCCLIPYIPLSLNLECWEFPPFPPALPTDFVLPAVCTMSVGLSLADLYAALIDVAIMLATSVVMLGVGKAAGFAKKLGKQAMKAKNYQKALQTGAKAAAKMDDLPRQFAAKERKLPPEALEKIGRAGDEAAQKAAPDAANAARWKAIEEAREQAIKDETEWLKAQEFKRAFKEALEKSDAPNPVTERMKNLWAKVPAPKWLMNPLVKKAHLAARKRATKAADEAMTAFRKQADDLKLSPELMERVNREMDEAARNAAEEARRLGKPREAVEEAEQTARDKAANDFIEREANNVRSQKYYEAYEEQMRESEMAAMAGGLNNQIRAPYVKEFVKGIIGKEAGDNIQNAIKDAVGEEYMA